MHRMQFQHHKDIPLTEKNSIFKLNTHKIQSKVP